MTNTFGMIFYDFLSAAKNEQTILIGQKNPLTDKNHNHNKYQVMFKIHIPIFFMRYQGH